ncbi:MAG: hypothetical protein U5Q03_19255 [Bacteroidota bacterium]|nr:hypothetical protein [Bacteroidota bacterium]
MKKFLLINLALLFITGLNAQSLQVSFEGEQIENGAAFSVFGEPDAGEIVIDNFEVKNISDNSLDILAKKKVISSVEGTYNTFCWANLCYPPNTIVSDFFTTLGPGESATDFSGHYNPAGTIGVSVVEYVFFDMNNTSDTFYIQITYSSVMPSFEMTYEGESIENGTEFLVEGSPDSSELKLKDFIVENTSDNTIDVYARKQIVSEMPGSYNTFCWAGLCYDPGTITSTQYFTLAPGESGDDFLKLLLSRKCGRYYRN